MAGQVGLGSGSVSTSKDHRSSFSRNPYSAMKSLQGAFFGGRLISTDDLSHAAQPRDLPEVIHHTSLDAIARDPATEYERHDAHLGCAAPDHGDAGNSRVAEYSGAVSSSMDYAPQNAIALSRRASDSSLPRI